MIKWCFHSMLQHILQFLTSVIACVLSSHCWKLSMMCNMGWIKKELCNHFSHAALKLLLGEWFHFTAQPKKKRLKTKNSNISHYCNTVTAVYPEDINSRLTASTVLLFWHTNPLLSSQKDTDMSEADIMTNLCLFLDTAAALIGCAVPSCRRRCCVEQEVDSGKALTFAEKMPAFELYKNNSL